MRKMLLIFLMCITLLLTSCTSNSKTSENNKNSNNSATKVVDVLVEKGYTSEQAKEIEKILNSVGIQSIEIYNMSGNAQKGLNAVVCYPNGFTNRSQTFYFTTDNGVVFYVGFSDEDLYDSDKGGFLKRYQDVHVS